MRTALLLITTMAVSLGGCFLSPDERRIDAYGTDTGCDPGLDVIDGMGDTCQSDKDCPAGAPYCFTNPMDSSQVGCTIKKCSAGDCPTCYQCCDCSALMPDMILCLPEDQLSQLPPGCTCS